MNNHEEYNDCEIQPEQIYKIKANGIKIRNGSRTEKILKILSKPRKESRPSSNTYL